MPADLSIRGGGILMKRLQMKSGQGSSYWGRLARIGAKTGGALAGAFTLLVLSAAPVQAVMVTVTGHLTNDADDQSFFMRDSYGTAYKVDTRRFVGTEGADKLLEGNAVRVHGDLVNGV